MTIEALHLLAGWLGVSLGERNRLKPVYDSRGRSFNLAEATMPRFDLLDIQRYNRLPKQMSVDELNSGLLDLTQKIYSDDAVNKRVRCFFKRKKELAAQEKEASTWDP